MHYSNPTVVTFITTMQIVSAAKALIPSFQAYSDDDKRNERVLTSERANQFMKLTHKNAMVMNEMLTKLKKAGMQETIDAIANPA